MDNERGLQSNAYQKKMNIGQSMHYASNQPEHVKVGTIKILAIWEKIVCNTEESLTDDHPVKSITKLIRWTLLSNSRSKGSRNLEAPNVFMPYQRIAEQLKRVANRHGLEVIFTRSLSQKSKLWTNPCRRVLRIAVHVESYTGWPVLFVRNILEKSEEQ